MKLIRFILIASVSLTIFAMAKLCMVEPWFIVIFAVAGITVASKRSYTRLTAFGTAAWASAEALDRAKMLGSKSNGLILGRMEVPRPKFRAILALFNIRIKASVACEEFLALFHNSPKQLLVRLTNAVHSVIFAPTGVGKTVSCVIPFLMDCIDSMVVIDFKGELAKLTADHRRKMGHKVIILDPFGAVGGTDTFNPLDCIDADNPLALDEIHDLAESLVPRTGQEKEPHWPDAAETMIAAMVAVVVQFAEKNNRSLQTIRPLLTNTEKLQAAINLMCQSDAWDGLLARLGGRAGQFKDKELGSVLTTTNRFLRFLDSTAITANTKASTFDPADLRKGRMTVYFVLPQEHARVQSPLLRMWTGSMLRAIVRGGLCEKSLIHLILDEAACLGKMEAISDALTMGRAYGIRIQLYYQDCGQLKRCWPDGADQTLMANSTQVFFGTNDIETAKYINERLGEATIIVRSGGTNTGTSYQTSDDGSRSYSRSTGSSDNWSQQARPLLKPDEILNLDPRIAIAFTPGVLPCWTRLLRFYEERTTPPLWRERLWTGVKMFAGSIFILAIATMLALGASAFVNEKAQERRMQKQQSFYR